MEIAMHEFALVSWLVSSLSEALYPHIAYMGYDMETKFVDTTTISPGHLRTRSDAS